MYVYITHISLVFNYLAQLAGLFIICMNYFWQYTYKSLTLFFYFPILILDFLAFIFISIEPRFINIWLIYRLIQESQSCRRQQRGGQINPGRNMTFRYASCLMWWCDRQHKTGDDTGRERGGQFLREASHLKYKVSTRP